MKKVIIPVLLVLTALVVRGAAAQPPDHQDRKERVDRVERFKQMRLIEELQLGEEEAVRFMAKRKEHEDRMKALSGDRAAILDGLGKGLGVSSDEAPPERKPDEAAIEKEIARVFEQDRKLSDERKRYQDEMRQLLPTEKFARMLIFERDFQAQVRNAMGERMKKRSSKFDD